jgi:CRP-like cAMP-binding protein
MEATQLHFDLLRRMPVFGGLNDATLQLILSRSQIVFVASGAYFFHEGAGAESFFVLEKGSVLIERKWEQSTLELGRLRRGDCIGEMAIIDLMPRSASIRAEVDCEAIEITLRVLRELYKQEVEQYAIIMMNMGREVSRRLRNADDQLLALEQKYRQLPFHETNQDEDRS